MAEDRQILCKVEDLCRLCLEGPGCVDIFKTYLLPQNIYSCTGVQVTPSDRMPKTVCRTCFDIINRAYRLRLTAAANDKHLQALMKSAIYLENGEQSNQEKKSVLHEGTNDASVSTYVKKEIIDDNVNETQDPCLIASEHNESCPLSRTIKVRSDLYKDSSHEASEELKEHPKVVQKDASDPEIEHKCNICCKSFETRKKLYLHNRLHNKTKFCPIPSCSKKFATKGDLERHIRTHTGVKPYVCNICERAFTQGGTLKIHLEYVHGVCQIETHEELTIS